jgi:Fe-S-cluster-containing dehydrogenase component
MTDTKNFQEEKKHHWMSIESKDRKDIRQLQNQEFFTSPDPVINRIKTGEFDRSTFLKLMGASAAMLTVNCLPQSKEKIVPYVDKPEHITHGIANYYASTCSGCSAACGLLIKTKEGRPLKLEGNPNHPTNKGALCATGQASILNLYDPDRAQSPFQIEGGKATPIKWEDLQKAVSEALATHKGKTFLFTGPINSPTTKKLIGEFLAKIGGGSHLEYDATSPEESIALAAEASYGKAVVPNYHFDKAKVIFSLEADFLGTWLSPTEFSKKFSAGRKITESNPSINQLFVAESMPSVTGSAADHRLPIRSGDARRVALAVAKAISELGGNSFGQLNGVDVDTLSKEMGIDPASIRKVAQALYSAKGESLVVGNGNVDLQIAVNLLNSMLDNDGKTIDSIANRGNGVLSSKNLEILKKALESGEVGVLFVNSNLLYQLPESLGWKSLLGKAKLVVSLQDRLDETTLGVAKYLAPTNHFLESWGDSEAITGVVGFTQPTINPLFDTRSFEDTLITFAGGEIGGFNHYYDYLKASYTKLVGDKGWIGLLKSGFSSKGDLTGNKPARAFRGAVKPLESRSSGLSLTLYQTVGLGDGTHANNPTLQELPDPITKVTWDNFVAISPTLASNRGLQSNDQVKVKAGKGVEMILPVQVQPGMHKDTVAIALGYGRTGAGKVGNGVGKNSYELAGFQDGSLLLSGLSVEFEKTGKKYKLASTQDHHMMNPGNPLGTKWEDRALILSTTLTNYQNNPASGTEKADPEFPNIGTDKKKKLAKGFNPEYEYKGYKWGMSIDLTLCTGCSACVIACQVENNIPVVGRDEVRLGREMHWIRIDRYYIGDPNKPESMEIAHQPVMCQHCDNAPCETVCPVAATVHGSEGTNDMVYNRCVGTRYCSNNCPYKVRRFNWMEHWRDGKDFARAPRNLAFNPDVTVRARGVMEKCTFCSSRIAEKKIRAKNEGRTVKDGELKTACQETCPADAITFGNTNDKESQVSKYRDDKRAYRILDFLNIKPQVSYLTRVRNV